MIRFNNDEIRFETRKHVLTLVWPLLKWGVPSVLAWFGFFHFREQELPRLILFVAGLLLFASVIYQYLLWHRYYVRVTPARVSEVGGVLDRSGFDYSIDAVINVELDQSLLGRIFDYGTLEILTANEQSGRMLSDIAHPAKLREALFIARDQNSQRALAQLAAHVETERRNKADRRSAARPDKDRRKKPER